ncbi:uncharacterized protein C05D11.1-like [Macrosteles quadrilineatus]|uniref:uncharacterized protein C05D11.1-like n=1 Tax=Macrosteles quadrilineatus TaxID=74068 RepID=UPI0023E1EFEB|nr:uncharacterized protein C05D11.1-like [Macrosteles quadrilineatus]
MAPVDKSPPAKAESNFYLVCSSKANDLIPVHKYKSSLTGLTIVLAEVEGPVVNGYFCLATEAHDDDGLPHTLEHLVFLGSEQYPYKGVLDLLANRCLASGTNAWTDTDHTCYTMTTAGSEGFLSLIPIYLDHILYPTLTDSAFVTEVHHVTGEGEDAGVVYCEMQGRENTGESRVYLQLLRTIYPGHCGYKSETGGIMRNLRETVNNDKVRAYHKEFYRPENLTLIITGQVKPEDLFKTLEPFEQKIASKGTREQFKRPWQDPVPPLKESADIEVKFPCDEEDNGMVYVGWRGPSAVTDLYKLAACSVLMKYMTDTSVSPLPKEFVEISDPYCSKVSYSLVENSESVLMLQFENVPVAKIGAVKDRLMQVLEKIVSGQEPIVMKRLSTVVNRHRLECLSHLENSPHDSIAFMAIGDMLYGNTKQDLDQRLNQVADLYKMQEEDMTFWTSLIKQYLLTGASVTVRGVPSVDEQQEMAREEKLRVQSQRDLLGVDGLKEKELMLTQAMEQNEIPPPAGMLKSVNIPSIESIQFHRIQTFTTDSKQPHPMFDTSQVPVYIQVDHITTNFVYIFVLMDTVEVQSALRPYLPLLFEALLECPVQRGDHLVPWEEVVAQLEADTVAAVTRLGLETTSRFQCGPYCQTGSLMLQLEPSKYERGIEWVKELLYNTHLNAERLKIIAAKMVNDVAQVKRKGNTIVRELMKGLLYTKESNHHTASVLRQHKFLSQLLDRLNSPEECDRVVAEIDQVRKMVTHPSNMVVHLAANLDTLAARFPNPGSLWGQLLPDTHSPHRHKLRVTSDWELLQDSSASKIHNCVVGIGAVESAYYCHTAPAIRDFLDPDLAPLLVFLQYLTQLEGPMWRLIRGQGFAYSYNMIPRPNEGLLYLTFYKATNVIGAYNKTKVILDEKLADDVTWEDSLFESAKSSLIFEIIEREKSIGDVVAQSLLSYFKHVDHNYNRWLVSMIAKVTKEDLSRMGPKYVKLLFDPSISRTSIVCHPSKVDELNNGFKELGINLTSYTTLEETFLNDW